MDKVFQQAKDKNVAAVLIYVNDNDYACVDAAGETKMTKAQLRDAFLKRSFVVSDGDFYVPTEMVVEDDYVSVTAGEITAYSDGYTAQAAGGAGGET